MPEIITLALSADINGDQRIDYEELMLYFHDILKMTRYHAHLHEFNKNYKNSI